MKGKKKRVHVGLCSLNAYCQWNIIFCWAIRKTEECFISFYKHIHKRNKEEEKQRKVELRKLDQRRIRKNRKTFAHSTVSEQQSDVFIKWGEILYFSWCLIHATRNVLLRINKDSTLDRSMFSMLSLQHSSPLPSSPNQLNP